MKPFNLERALAGDPVITRAGDIVTEIYHLKTAHRVKDKMVIVGIIDGNINYFNDDGEWIGETQSEYDLFMLPTKKTYWVNIYRCDIATNNVYVRGLFDTEGEAIKGSVIDSGLLTTISFEIEG